MKMMTLNIVPEMIQRFCNRFMVLICYNDNEGVLQCRRTALKSNHYLAFEQWR